MKCEKCLAPTNQKLCYECWCFKNNARPPRSERELLTEGIPLDRLEAICAAERDGRVVVLPCKVGDTVYRIEEYHCCTNPDWDSSEVVEHEFGLEDIARFGKTIFLTREEAEAAMEGE